jgi:hypothetical protein
MLPLVQVCFYLHFSLIDLLVALIKILGFTFFSFSLLGALNFGKVWRFGRVFGIALWFNAY